MFRSLRRWSQTLQARLTVLVLLAVGLSVAIATAASLREAEATLLTVHHRSLDGETLRMARLLDHRAVDQRQVLDIAADGLPAAARADAGALQAWLLQRPLLRAQFDVIFYIDSRGRVVLMYDEQGFKRPALDVADRSYFQRTVHEGQGVISEPLAGRVAQQPVIVMTAPVRSAGQTVGVLAGAVRLRTHSMLAGLEQPLPEATTTLVALSDARGRLLAHPDPAYIGAAADTDPRLAAALAALQARPDGGRTQQAFSINTDADVGAVAELPRVGWMLWRLQDRAEVMAPVAAAQQRALRATLGLAVGLLPLVAVILWWALRPLRRLAQQAEAVFDMAPGQAAGFGQGEIGRVAGAMQRVGHERRELAQQHAQQLARLRSVMEAAPLGLMFTRERRFELVSPHACRLLGLPEQALIGQPAEVIYADAQDYARLGPAVGAAFARREPVSVELRFRRGDKDHFLGRLTGQPVDWADAAAGTIWTLVDVTREIEARDQLEWTASHDTLTGLANRVALQRELARVLGAARVAPAPPTPAALLMLDLDRFKPINDQHGHAAGDAMLREVARAISACVRVGDLVSRSGGDEFFVLLERCPPDAALRLAENIRAAVDAARVDWHGAALGVGASIGMAPLGDHLDTEAWMAAADAAAYEAKRAGRNTVKAAAPPSLSLVGAARSA